MNPNQAKTGTPHACRILSPRLQPAVTSTFDV